MKYALCNEMFEPLSLVKSCRLAVQYGFSGMELAPFTLSDSPQLMRKEARWRAKYSGGLWFGIRWFSLVAKYPRRVAFDNSGYDKQVCSRRGCSLHTSKTR